MVLFCFWGFILFFIRPLADLFSRSTLFACMAITYFISLISEIRGFKKEKNLSYSIVTKIFCKSLSALLLPTISS